MPKRVTGKRAASDYSTSDTSSASRPKFGPDVHSGGHSQGDTSSGPCQAPGPHQGSRDAFHGNSKYDAWVFVLNGEMSLSRLPLHFDARSMHLLCYQQEIGGVAGRLHVQGYVKTKMPVRACTVAAQMGAPWNRRGETAEGQVSFRPARGTMRQNAAYCTSLSYCRVCHGGIDGMLGSSVCTCGDATLKGRVPQTTVFEGEFVEDDKLTPADIVKKIQEGIGMSEMFLKHPVEMFRYGRQFQMAATCIAPKRREKPLVIWLNGAAGSGKSKFTHEIVDERHIYMTWSAQWFDGYDPAIHLLFVMDDMRGADVSPTWLLRLLDRYQFKVAVKGASIEFRSPVIIITSAQTPQNFWREACEKYARSEEYEQLGRRLDHVLQVPFGRNEKEMAIGRCRARMQWSYNDTSDRPIGWLPGHVEIPYPLFQVGGSSGSAGPVYESAPDAQARSPVFEAPDSAMSG